MTAQEPMTHPAYHTAAFYQSVPQILDNPPPLGSPRSPVNKNTLTLLAVSSCVLAVVYGSQLPCPLTVKVTLHVPEHFIADGSSFVVSMGSYLDVSDWLNPAKLSLYYQTNSTSPWVRDYCGQRTTAPCEQLCDQETEDPIDQEPGEFKWTPAGMDDIHSRASGCRAVGSAGLALRYLLSSKNVFKTQDSFVSQT
ncbi:UNVERIFIED_CONTAM: hypothetical protein FKN15_037032 [Acipenser sinensis]